jgi:hypothetical protein
MFEIWVKMHRKNEENNKSIKINYEKNLLKNLKHFIQF